MHTDYLQRFLFEEMGVRGALVRLEQCYSSILEHQELSDDLSLQLGESLAAATLLSTSVKPPSALRLQLQDNAGEHMLLAQCDHRRCLRGLVRWPGSQPKKDSFAAFADGNLLMSVDNEKSGQSYQGIMAVSGNSLGDTIEHHFMRIEHLPTLFHLHANKKQAVGLMLQALPHEAKDVHCEDDYWQHLMHLTHTLSNEELCDLAPQDVLHRLYHQEPVRLFEAESVSFFCSCSLPKMEQVIRSLGRSEADSLLEENPIISITCDFCNQTYQFDQVDVGRIFAEGKSGENGGGTETVH